MWKKYPKKFFFSFDNTKYKFIKHFERKSQIAPNDHEKKRPLERDYRLMKLINVKKALFSLTIQGVFHLKGRKFIKILAQFIIRFPISLLISFTYLDPF